MQQSDNLIPFIFSFSAERSFLILKHYPQARGGRIGRKKERRVVVVVVVLTCPIVCSCCRIPAYRQLPYPVRASVLPVVKHDVLIVVHVNLV
jgi:hypothetical protein